jgi:hypothetical protein
MTSVQSASCGTHLGETKLVASITDNPLAESLLMNSTFVAVGMVPGSFCRPSRGPTSTIVTLLGKLLPGVLCRQQECELCWDCTAKSLSYALAW